MGVQTKIWNYSLPGSGQQPEFCSECNVTILNLASSPKKKRRSGQHYNLWPEGGEVYIQVLICRPHKFPSWTDHSSVHLKIQNSKKKKKKNKNKEEQCRNLVILLLKILKFFNLPLWCFLVVYMPVIFFADE